jgi:hypothetical protein
MPFKRYKICTRQESKKEGGKTYWPEVGTLWDRDGKFHITLNMFPDVAFFCFDVDKKEDKPVSENPPF